VKTIVKPRSECLKRNEGSENLSEFKRNAALSTRHMAESRYCSRAIGKNRVYRQNFYSGKKVFYKAGGRKEYEKCFIYIIYVVAHPNRTFLQSIAENQKSRYPVKTNAGGSRHSIQAGNPNGRQGTCSRYGSVPEAERKKTSCKQASYPVKSVVAVEVEGR